MRHLDPQCFLPLAGAQCVMRYTMHLLLNVTDCDVYMELYPDPATSVYAMAVFAIVYVLIFVLGIAGNVAVIHVTLQHRTLQTVQNIFILNLAASDIIVCLLSLPITPVTNISKNWFFGDLLCRLIPYVQGVSVFICTFSLAAIALDRYVLIVRPHSTPLSRHGALVLTACLWSTSMIVTLPYALFMFLDHYEGVCGVFCTEKWPNAFSRRAYTICVLIAQFVLPFIVMAFCYASIFARLRNRARVRLRRIDARSLALERSTATTNATASMHECKHNHDANIEPGGEGNEEMTPNILSLQDKERHQLLHQTRRTTVILASMVVIFGLTWMPHNVVSLIMEYDERHQLFQLFDRVDLDMSYLVNLVTHSVAMTNNVANPVLYAWLNPTFRQFLIRVCHRGKPPRDDQKRSITRVPTQIAITQKEMAGARRSVGIHVDTQPHCITTTTNALHCEENGDHCEKRETTQLLPHIDQDNEEALIVVQVPPSDGNNVSHVNVLHTTAIHVHEDDSFV